MIDKAIIQREITSCEKSIKTIERIFLDGDFDLFSITGTSQNGLHPNKATMSGIYGDPIRTGQLARDCAALFLKAYKSRLSELREELEKE